MSRFFFKQRVIRVFLSSTFRDFGEERDLLVRKVFPTLRARLAERFVDLVDVDLRWGITEAEAEQGEVLPICLAEIDRARPFFIGLLGERYGWIPPAETYPPTVLEQHPWLEEHRGGKSVTELEILHGVLNNPAMAGRAMFYFRSPDYAKTKGGDYVALSAEDQAKQDALKDWVRASEFPVVENYATPEDVAERIQEDLWSALEIEFPATEVPDAFTRDLLQHEAYAAPRRRIYLGGETYLQALDQALKDNTQWILLNGESGSGKSALLANWIEGLTDEDLITHVHYVGANPSATDPVAMVRRIIEWIRRETNTEDEPASDPEELLDSLPEWLSRASAWASLNNTRFLLILDALNGISDRRDLRWFPSFLPAHLQCVVSTLPGEVRDNLMDKAPWHVIDMHPLDAKTARQVFITYLGLYNKTLPDPLIDQVMDHPLVTNPLFLMTLAEELRLFGEHEQLSQQLAHYQESLTVDDLFERVLARIEADHGAAIIRQIMTALWASRSGLREEELLAYTSLPLMKWSYIRHALGPALIESNGRYVFAHDYLRIAVSDRYMAGNNSLEDDGQSEEALKLRQDAHIQLAQWFEEHAFQDNEETVSATRAAEEIPYQWLKAQHWEKLATTLTQLEMFRAFIAAHPHFWDLRCAHSDYWNSLENNYDLRKEYGPQKDQPPLKHYLFEIAWSHWNLDQDDISTAKLAIDLNHYCFAFSEMRAKRETFTAKLCHLAVDISKRVLGPDHPDVADYLRPLASNYRYKNYALTLSLYRESLSIKESARGPNHIETAEALRKLADYLIRGTKRGQNSPQESFVEAEKLYRRALPIFEDVYGLDHVISIDVADALAFLLDKKKDLNGAESLYRRIVKGKEIIWGKNHKFLRYSLFDLARILVKKNDLNSARPFYRRAFEILQKHESPFVIANWYRKTAILLHSREYFEESSNYFEKALAIIEKTKGADHPDLARVLQEYGVLFRSSKRYDEALDILNRALAINEKNAGPDSEEVASTLSALGKLFELQEQYEESLQSYTRAITIRESLVGPLHPDTARLYFRLGELELNRGNKTSAKEAFKKAWDGYEDAYGSENEETVSAREAYENC